MTAIRARWPRSLSSLGAVMLLTSLFSHAHAAEQGASRDLPKLGRLLDRFVNRELVWVAE